MRMEERNKLDVIEMKYLQSIYGRTRMNRLKNEEEGHRIGVRKTMSICINPKVFKEFGHMEGLTKRLYVSVLDRRKDRVRPFTRCMD